MLQGMPLQMRWQHHMDPRVLLHLTRRWAMRGLMRSGVPCTGCLMPRPAATWPSTAMRPSKRQRLSRCARQQIHLLVLGLTVSQGSVAELDEQRSVSLHVPDVPLELCREVERRWDA